MEKHSGSATAGWIAAPLGGGRDPARGGRPLPAPAEPVPSARGAIGGSTEIEGVAWNFRSIFEALFSGTP
jgi:hypothetical protein